MPGSPKKNHAITACCTNRFTMKVIVALCNGRVYFEIRNRGWIILGVQSESFKQEVEISWYPGESARKSP